MDCTATRIPYRQTNYFSKLVLDYIDQLPGVEPFFAYAVSVQGITGAIQNRQKFPTNRKLLVQELKKQYETVAKNEHVLNNIESLKDENTFTIVTAHQNNIFTGPLYFIYKILHTAKLAEKLKESLPGYNFVPVFYIGSEDADLAELNHIYLGDKKLVWSTTQQGAVGRMKTDAAFTELLTEIENQLLVLPFGNEIMTLVKEAYQEGLTIEEATFRFVHHLFSVFGLVVLKPDNAKFKKEIIDICEDELFHQSSSAIVQTTIDALNKASYKVQAQPRDINLFYLTDNFRERIVEQNGNYQVLNTDIQFSKEELKNELKKHPERFSPNVILRGLYQEKILPNIAFIGGGGELSYWLQLKSLFENHQIPFPVLVLRNSFLLVEKKWQSVLAKLQLPPADIFLPDNELVRKIIERFSNDSTELKDEITALEKLYDRIAGKAQAIDSTLLKHVEALKAKTLNRILQLEKKMLRAEKRKHGDQLGQLKKIKDNLFPANGLQERRDNILYYFAKFGPSFLQIIYQNALSLEQEFVLLTEN